MPVPSKKIDREGKIVKIVIKEKYLLGRENEVLPKLILKGQALDKYFSIFLYITTMISSESNNGWSPHIKILSKPTFGETVIFLFKIVENYP